MASEPPAADLAAFGASDAACYLYPGEAQAAERAAFCAGAAYSAKQSVASEPEPVAWACKTCNSPRSIDPCPKCGTSLTKPADGWEWPGLPDINRIRELAREVGYAVGVHGSQERDFDLIAAPWVENAVGPLELAQHIAAGLGGRVVDYERQDKPCGRWSCNIHTPDWTKLIDLSVMPPAREEAALLAAERRGGDAERAMLDWMAKDICLELSWGQMDPQDEGGECGWMVHRRWGNINDTEWHLIGTGDTPAEAIAAAIRKGDAT